MYSNVRSALNKSVWAITEGKMNEIIGFLERLNGQDITKVGRKYEDDPYQSAKIRVEGSVAVVPVYDTIMQRANLFMEFSGGTSTQQLQTRLDTLAKDDSISTIVLDVNSGGGSVLGLAEVASKIRSIRETKRVVTVFTGMGASAAYFIGSAADTVYASPSSMVGSIGTLLIHEDNTKAYEEEGRKYEIIRSTPMKAVANDKEPLSDEGRNELQRMVDSYNKQFIENVAANREISFEAAAKLADGRIYSAEEALEMELVDGIKSLEDVLADLGEDAEYEAKFDAVSAEYEAAVAKNEELVEKVESLQDELDSLKAEYENERIEAKVKELTEGPDARIAPMQADRLRDRLRADFEGTLATLEFIPKGTGVPPSGDVEQPTSEDGPLGKEKTVEEIKDEAGVKFLAFDNQMVKSFEDFGYVEGEEFIKAPAPHWRG